MATLTINAADEKRVKAMGFLSNKGTDDFSGRGITVNGKITAEQMQCIGEAAKLFGNGNVTFTTRLTVEVQGIPFDRIPDFQAYIAKMGLVTGGTGRKVRPVVSCKGTTCQYGLIDTFALSEEIHHRFFEGYADVTFPHKFKIAVGGCPNNCVKPDLNDLGVVGQHLKNFNENLCKGCKKCRVLDACPMHAGEVKDGLLSVDSALCNNCGRCVGKCPFGAVTEGEAGYQIYIGGRWGKQTAMGRPLTKIFTDKEEVLQVIEKALQLFRDQGIDGERFATTVHRLGFENVEAQLLGDALPERKEAVIRS